MKKHPDPQTVQLYVKIVIQSGPKLTLKSEVRITLKKLSFLVIKVVPFLACQITCFFNIEFSFIVFFRLFYFLTQIPLFIKIWLSWVFEYNGAEMHKDSKTISYNLMDVSHIFIKVQVYLFNNWHSAKTGKPLTKM